MKKIELTNRKSLTEIQKLKIKNNALRNEIRLLKDQCDIHVISGSLKQTMTLGVTPSSFFDDNKPNYQILNINYNFGDGRGDLVRVTLEVGAKVDVVEISTQEAVYLGFINPYGLKYYCRHT